MNVYDFDETIYAGESCVDFALFFFKKEPKLIRYFPDIIRSYLLYKKQKISFQYFIDRYAEIFEKYFSGTTLDFEALMPEFWTEKRLKKKIRPFYLQLHRPDDLVITASPEFLVKYPCEKLGIHRIIATEFDLKTGKFGKPCFRESKVECLKNGLLPGEEVDDFYTDSMNDRFLMPFAKRSFLVKGNRIIQVYDYEN